MINPVVIRAKVEEVQTNIAIYSHALPRMQVIGGQRSVRIAPPSLPPHHSSPATIHDYSYHIVGKFQMVQIFEYFECSLRIRK